MSAKRHFLLYVWFAVLALMPVSCHPKILVAMDTHKLHDEYIMLYRNGKFKFKISPAGLVKLKGKDKGRYLISGDTVFFVRGKPLQRSQAYGYGIIDTAQKIFLYRPDDPSVYTIYTLVRYRAVKAP